MLGWAPSASILLQIGQRLPGAPESADAALGFEFLLRRLDLQVVQRGFGVRIAEAAITTLKWHYPYRGRSAVDISGQLQVRSRMIVDSHVPAIRPLLFVDCVRVGVHAIPEMSITGQPATT